MFRLDDPSSSQAACTPSWPPKSKIARRSSRGQSALVDYQSRIVAVFGGFRVAGGAFGRAARVLLLAARAH